MFYTVECSFTDPEREAEWNAFYRHNKLPALISVAGFTTSQRFRAVKSGCPVYLALHTIKDGDILSSADSRLKGGGNFSRWQVCITDWHRNLYGGEGLVPAISYDEKLLLSAKPIRYGGLYACTGRCHLSGLGVDNAFSLFWLPWQTRICSPLAPR